MALANVALIKISFRLLLSGILLSGPSAVWAIPFESEVELLRPDEPAMRDIVGPQTLNDIRDIMIKESLDKHGFCACPYSTDALGGPCGTLSAYYVPWNKVLCYRRDITSDMIYFYRLQRATNARDAEQKKRDEESSDEQNQATLEKNKEITADYFRNSAKPLPNTITLPSNIPNPTANIVPSTYQEQVSGDYFKNTVPVTPAQGLTNLIAPPVPSNIN